MENPAASIAWEDASGTAELEAKRARLQRWLGERGLDGILLRRHENLAWSTAGRFEARVLIPGETAVAALLLLRDGRRFALLPNNEAPRLEAEELDGLGFEPVVRSWHALDFAAETRAIGGAKLGSDTPLPDLRLIDLAPLRAPLLPPEAARFRLLGAAAAEAVTDVLRCLRPGVSEREMEAWTAERLLSRGVFPSVLLTAADERILRYKHAAARGATLERFGMLNLCARRWGLAVSLTRFVHFGPMPAALLEGFDAAARVNAALLHATRAGATSAGLFRVAAEAYAAAGFPGEEQMHHQGGACGYLEREWVAAPEGTEVVQPMQAFAWNPSCRGGKVEDTVLLVDGRPETLTRTPDLPEMMTEAGGSAHLSAGVLARD